MGSYRELRGSDSSSSSYGVEAWKAMCKVRDNSPLIQCITNFVSMDMMANTLLAAGASPAMVHAIEEVTEFTGLANALCMNVGTLSSEWIFSMKAAAYRANELKKPWVLDPVGIGATKFRTEKCAELIDLRPAVIRGDAPEIVAALLAVHGKPIDCALPTKDVLEAAKELARVTHAVVAVTGDVDLVTDGKRVLRVSNGVTLMQQITATGCAVTALIAAFVATHPGRVLEAAAFAIALFGVAGEIGMEKANGPGSLRMHLVDALYSLDEANVVSRIRIAQV